jgi:hypothetical protein
LRTSSSLNGLMIAMMNFMSALLAYGFRSRARLAAAARPAHPRDDASRNQAACQFPRKAHNVKSTQFAVSPALLRVKIRQSSAHNFSMS